MKALASVLWMLRHGACALMLCWSGAQAQTPAAPVESSCTGKYPNPLTDICWSCMLPLTIGGATVANLGSQEDIPNPPTAVCSCTVNPVVGIGIGFWEPARMVEVVRKPFCLPTLGGVNLNPGIGAPQGSVRTSTVGADNGGAFYQAHYYMNTIMALLQVVVDFPCLEQGALDLVYMTEVDPLWNDDELSAVLQPEAVLFANPPAQLACVTDCLQSSFGFGNPSLFWCAGCQGSLYPTNGHVPGQLGGVRSAELIAQRLLWKMHREQIAWGWHGQAGMCGPYLLPQMDKRAYKMQLVFPVPATQKVPGKQEGGGSAPPAPLSARCCQPLGRSTVLWGMGKEYPVKGEDFGFLVFRKRNCCVGY